MTQPIDRVAIEQKRKELIEVRERVQQQYYQVSGAIALLDELLNPTPRENKSPT